MTYSHSGLKPWPYHSVYLALLLGQALVLAALVLYALG
jgi:hypothetical protein